MPKSRHGKGRHHRSKKSKAIERQLSVIQRTATAPGPGPVAVDMAQPETVSEAPSAPAEPAAPALTAPAPKAITTQYHFIVDELKRIGILAGIILVILIILSIILS
jgi:hypothetical protein